MSSITQKYQGKTREKTSDGISTTITYFGSYADLYERQQRLAINSLDENGRLRSANLHQDQGNIWNLDLVYDTTSSGSTNAEKPSREFGVKSCTLNTALVAFPIQKAKKYCYKWDHWLFWRKGDVTTPPANPPDAYNQTGTAAPSLGDQWAWGSSDTPPDSDTDYPFQLYRVPTKQGVTAFDVPVPTVTESACFRTPALAGNWVGSKINEIGTPSETFGYFSGYEWKCDDSSVAYSDGYGWIATLTWTGTPGLIDRDLYGPNTGPATE